MRTPYTSSPRARIQATSVRLQADQRRWIGSFIGLAAGVALLAASAAAHAFGFDEVAERAKALAAKPYVAPPDNLPAELKNLNYDQMRDIRFKPARALWREDKLPFELMFFHLGHYQTQAVRINEIVGGQARPVPFRREDFDYGKNRQLSPQKWGDVGFAGFRAHYHLNNDQYKDELAVFLGASYFRVLGANQHYGLSARGLAIDTVGGKGEEFPRFSEFWIERPAADARTLTVHALMDSQRASGAYTFVIKPGAETIVETRARRFLRAPQLGELRLSRLAPVPARAGRNARARAADQHVPVRREPAAEGRLPARGPRQRRPDGRQRLRRMDLAPADQSQGHADDLVHAAGREGLRPDAARSPLRQL